MLLAFLNYTTIGHVTSKHLGSNAVTYNIIGLNTFFFQVKIKIEIEMKV